MMDAATNHAPLAGVRVVEVCRGAIRAAGRLFADLGADVVTVSFGSEQQPVPPGGTLTREEVETYALARGKRSLRIDPDLAADLDRLNVEITGCDIVLDDGSLAAAGDPRFAIEVLAQANPALVIVALSGFGRSGPLANWTATDPVLHALSGGLSRSGIPGRPPLLPPAAIATRSAAAQAVFVALLTFLDCLDSGQGDVLDFAMLDGVAQVLDPGFGVSGSAADGVRASNLPRGRPDVRNQYPIIPCADGFVRLCVLSPRQWRGMFAWMGSPPEFADPAYETLSVRFGSVPLIGAMTRFFADRTCRQLEEEAQRFGVPAAAVQNFRAAAASEQFRARDLFEAHALRGIEVTLPKSPFEIDGRRLSGAAGAARDPALRVALAGSRRRFVQAPPTGPLHGLRVLDLGVIVVGAETGRLLADAGADVVKVENDVFPDGARQTRDGSLMSPSFAAGHRNKRSLKLDLRSEEGKRCFLDLIAQADVLLSNFKPGTLEDLGFDRATLAAINPALVSVQSSAFGTSGPQSRRLGYGPLVRAATGLCSIWSYESEAGSFSDAMTVYPDHVAGRLGAIAALALLVRRRRSGGGGTASLAQAEVILDHFDVDLAIADLRERGLAEPEPGPAGNTVFACSGEDDWCVVTPQNDEQWRAVADLLGMSCPATDPDADAAPPRSALVEALAVWLAGRSSFDAMAILQTAGIAAGAMLRVAEMPDFPHYRDRAFFREIANPALTSAFLVEARPVRAARLPDPDYAPAPLPGQDDAAVLRDWLAKVPRTEAGTNRMDPPT